MGVEGAGGDTDSKLQRDADLCNSGVLCPTGRAPLGSPAQPPPLQVLSGGLASRPGAQEDFPPTARLSARRSFC